MIDTKNVDTLVFSGGGVLISAYRYFLVKFDSTGLMNQINEFRGTSCGSIVAAMLAMGIPAEKLALELDMFDFKDILKGNFITNSWRFLFKKGYHSTKPLKKAIEKIVKKYGIDKDITFQNIHKELKIYTTCLTTGSVIESSKGFTPDMKIIDAIVMSCAIPFFFQPVKFDDYYYCDGGLILNYPVNPRGNSKEPDQVLGLMLGSKNTLFNKHFWFKNLRGYSEAVIKTVSRALDKTYIEDGFYERTCFIDTSSYESTDFDLDEKDQQILWDLSQESYKKYFTYTSETIQPKQIILEED